MKIFDALTNIFFCDVFDKSMINVVPMYQQGEYNEIDGIQIWEFGICKRLTFFPTISS